MDKIIARIGFYSSFASFVAALGYCVVQILQIAGVIVYPLDATLIYGFSLGIAAPFLVAMLALHYSTEERKRFFTHAALLFAVMYTIFVTIMYSVQLATVIPMSLRDPAPNLLTATPHSFFWTLDGLGYICMGISMLFVGFVFEASGVQKWLRWFFLANGLLVPVLVVVYFYPHFSVGLLYFAFPWGVLAPGSMLLLALFFRKRILMVNK